jgi:hypothetical protein
LRDGGRGASDAYGLLGVRQGGFDFPPLPRRQLGATHHGQWLVRAERVPSSAAGSGLFIRKHIVTGVPAQGAAWTSAASARSSDGPARDRIRFVRSGHAWIARPTNHRPSGAIGGCGTWGNHQAPRHQEVRPSLVMSCRSSRWTIAAGTPYGRTADAGLREGPEMASWSAWRRLRRRLAAKRRPRPGHGRAGLSGSVVARCLNASPNGVMFWRRVCLVRRRERQCRRG